MVLPLKMVERKSEPCTHLGREIGNNTLDITVQIHIVDPALKYLKTLISAFNSRVNASMSSFRNFNI